MRLGNGKIVSIDTEDGMSAHYRHVALAEVKPGMILSDKLLDQRGQLLLPQGTVLTAATIALFPRHGIEMLAILRTDGSPGQPAAPDEALVEQRLARLFRKNDIDNADDWATGILRRYVQAYRLGRELAK
jgi:hypothetical protein